MSNNRQLPNKTLIILAVIVVSVILIAGNISRIIPARTEELKNEKTEKQEMQTPEGQTELEKIELPPDVTPILAPQIDVEIPESDKITVKDVELRNFYKTAYSVGRIGDALLVDRPQYKIVYYPLDEAFLITILVPGFDNLRPKAEEDLLSVLQINESTACQLDVFTTTPRYANPAEAGKNWPLSFCQ
jgi:hypothetical protein